MSDSVTPWTVARQASLSFTISLWSNSCPLSWWCHPSISSSFFPVSSCLQSFPASGSFLIGQLFASGDQSIGASVSTSVLPMNVHWFPLGLTGLIGFLSKDSQESSPVPQFKTSVLQCSAFFVVYLSHWYMTTGKSIALIIWTFVGKVISLLFHTLSSFVIDFLPRSVF